MSFHTRSSWNLLLSWLLAVFTSRDQPQFNQLWSGWQISVRNQAGSSRAACGRGHSYFLNFTNHFCNAQLVVSFQLKIDWLLLQFFMSAFNCLSLFLSCCSQAAKRLFTLPYINLNKREVPWEHKVPKLVSLIYSDLQKRISQWTLLWKQSFFFFFFFFLRISPLCLRTGFVNYVWCVGRLGC